MRRPRWLRLPKLPKIPEFTREAKTSVVALLALLLVVLVVALVRPLVDVYAAHMEARSVVLRAEGQAQADKIRAAALAASPGAELFLEMRRIEEGSE